MDCEKECELYGDNYKEGDCLYCQLKRYVSKPQPPVQSELIGGLVCVLERSKKMFKRYTPELEYIDGFNCAGLAIDEDGEYVKHDDIGSIFEMVDNHLYGESAEEAEMVIGEHKIVIKRIAN